MPTIPEQLAEIIALHKSMFGGFEMNASTAGGDGAAQPTDPPADGANPPAEPPAQDSTDWKAEARKWEQRAKDNKSAADRLAQVEDANKTDLQKAQDAAAKAVADAQAAQLELSRERIARRHKLADEDAELLSGDEEQMERLAARLAQAATPPATPLSLIHI